MPTQQPGPDRPRAPRNRRDRRGRGLRGALAPRTVPIAQSRGDVFDALVLQAVDHLQPRLADQLAKIEFAVEDVPDIGRADDPLFDDDTLEDHAVPLSRVFRSGVADISGPVIVLYRRPLEARAGRREDLAGLVHDVVVEQVARLLGRSVDDIDPPLS